MCLLLTFYMEVCKCDKEQCTPTLISFYASFRSKKASFKSLKPCPDEENGKDKTGGLKIKIDGKKLQGTNINPIIYNVQNIKNKKSVKLLW